jgi:hypothetical protein
VYGLARAAGAVTNHSGYLTAAENSGIGVED